MILIFGDRRDPHVECIRGHLLDLGRSVLVFSRYDAEARISLDPASTDPVAIRVGAHEASGSEIEAVWWRQKPFYLFDRENPKRTEYRQYAGREWRALLDSLESLLPQARWMNSPARQRTANSKPLQLVWAKSCGFAVPETRFTNDYRAAEGLRSEGSGGTVYKPFTPFITADGFAVFTNDVSETDLASQDTSIGICPGIFQRKVEKDHELRLTFIGSTIFLVRIDSQAHADTKLDWRHGQENAMYRLLECPEPLTAQVRRFQQKSGLVFGAVDLIVDVDGNAWFLECNPAGQWLWLEEQLAFPASQTVARWLAGAEVPEAHASGH